MLCFSPRLARSPRLMQDSIPTKSFPCSRISLPLESYEKLSGVLLEDRTTPSSKVPSWSFSGGSHPCEEVLRQFSYAFALPCLALRLVREALRYVFRIVPKWISSRLIWVYNRINQGALFFVNDVNTCRLDTRLVTALQAVTKNDP